MYNNINTCIRSGYNKENPREISLFIQKQEIKWVLSDLYTQPMFIFIYLEKSKVCYNTYSIKSEIILFIFC